MSGIYSITSPSGNQYIGSAVSFRLRWNKHRSRLRAGTHHCAPLQASWEKYGEENFKFEVLIVCTRENLLFYEQSAIDILRPRYNVAKTAGHPTLGMTTGESTKTKISMAIKGIVRSEETRQRISRAATGRSHSASHRAANSAARKGKPLSADHIAKLSGSLNNNARAVICIDTGQRFGAMSLAVAWLRLNGWPKAAQSCISIACNGKIKRAYGYRWCYETPNARFAAP